MSFTKLTVEQIERNVWYGGGPRVMATIWGDGPRGVNYLVEGLMTIEPLWTDKEGFVRLANGEPETFDTLQQISRENAIPACTVINPDDQTDEQKAFFAALSKM